jgi:hypothetical protein
MDQKQKMANATYFEKMFSMTSMYMWQAKCHIYKAQADGRFACSSKEAYDDIAEITPKGWAKKHIAKDYAESV